MFKLKLSFASRLLVILAVLYLWGGHCITASATSTTYYAKVTATASPTGAGTVYVSSQNTAPTSENDYKSTSSATGNNTSQSISFYLFANPADGYAVSSWTDDKNNKAIIGSGNQISLTLSASSTTESSPTEFAYTAHFEKIGEVQVATENANLGAASISNFSNEIGDEVTLTANPKWTTFTGWEHNGEIVSTSPNYTFTVSSDNSGLYTATFESTVYCQIKNYANGHILGFYGTSGTGTYYTDDDYQRCISYSMMAANDNDVVRSSPAFVMKITGNHGSDNTISNVELTTNGIKYTDILNNFAQWTLKKHNLQSNGKSFDQSLTWNSQYSGHYLHMQVQGIGDAYFPDDGYHHNPGQPIEAIGYTPVPAMIRATSRTGKLNIYDNGVWKLLPFTEGSSDAYFGPLPTANQKFGDRYYTTMYTVFPYKCLDDVKAYTVSDLNEDGTLKLDEITSGIVPANTPVILASKTLKPKTNRLLPLIHDVDALTETNLLKGEVWIMKDETADPSTYRTAFDASSMRVLSSTDGTFKNENNKGFYVNYPIDNSNPDTIPSATANTVFPYIVNNTAYLSTDNMTDAQKALFAQHDTWKLFPDKAELSIDGDNGSADNWASVNASKVADVTLTRNMANDGGWYSLCLPFDINATDLKAAFGDDVDLEELSEATSSDNNVSVTFKKVDALTAGKPYLIKLSKDFTTYTFNDVTVYGDDVTPENFGNGYTFQGTKQFNAEDIRANYGTRARFLGGSDGLSLKKPSKSSKPLKPTRCFFVYPENTSSAKALTFTMHGQDTPTAIEHITLDDIDRDIQRPVDNRIYSLTGQYVGTDFSSLPKGIYIVNGKKVMK